MLSKLVDSFPLWASALAGYAYLNPEHFAAGKTYIIPLLALIMFAMGMTLTWSHYRSVLRTPSILALSIVIQFIFMPLLAYVISNLLELHSDQMAGMILVGSSAGGTASNVICYLAKANVALSVLLTLTSTFCAIVLMPLLTYLYLHQTFPIPGLEMTYSIIKIVMIPVLVGTLLNSMWGKRLVRIKVIFPALSSIAIAVIIAIIISLNQNSLLNLNLTLCLAVVLHNGLGLFIGYLVPLCLKYDRKTCRTLSIEVGMQNSGLSVALAIKFFGQAAALPGALFSLWHNISGSLLAHYWRRTDLSKNKV